MEELQLFPDTASVSTQILLTNFDEAAERFALPLLQQLRNAGVSSEIYPAPAKLQKQLKYANDKQIAYVALIGEEEMKSGKLSLKNMQSGEQRSLTIDEIIREIQ
jgi:histidyl-tRNA synthetase